jgi:hypothetical protein
MASCGNEARYQLCCESIGERFEWAHRRGMGGVEAPAAIFERHSKRGIEI